MDSKNSQNRKINPRENANIFSIFTFIFAFDPIRKGIKGDLKDKDIYEVLTDYKSEKLGNRLEELWKIELKKKHPYIIRPLFKMFGGTYIIFGFVMLIIETSMIYLKPMLMGKVVAYYIPNTSMTSEEAILYSIALIATTYAFHFWNHTFLLNIHEIFLKIRIACTSLIYRKCLKLNLDASQQFVTGMALTLMTKDLNAFDAGLDHVNVITCGIVQAVIMTIVVYREIGISALAAMALLICVYPIHGYLGYVLSKLRVKTSQYTDKRVRITQEILTAIRIIKMYTWELFFEKSINSIRKKEIKNLRHLFYLQSVVLSIGQLASQLALYVCVITYTGLGNYITADKAFVVIGSFGAVRDILSISLPLGITVMAEMKACITRLTTFLVLNELTVSKNIKYLNKAPHQVLIENLTVKSETDSKIFESLNLRFNEGLTAITGNVGTGKSTILKLILGEIDICKGLVTISGTVSYASQEPWLFPGTIRQNILFGEEFDEERYNKTVDVCALKQDFLVFREGDQTHLTDKGWNLSRGQKTRINLARAIYKQADIYLLDDCLSAVDTHVGKHILNRCLKEFLARKVCVVVTHQQQMLQEVDHVVLLGKNCVIFQGNPEDFFNSNVKEPLKITHKADKEFNMDTEKSLVLECPETLYHSNQNETSANIYAETKEVGAVKLKIYLDYLSFGGGYIVLTLIILLFTFSQVSSSWSDYFVSSWVDIQQEISDHYLNQTTNTTEYQQLEEFQNVHLQRYSGVILSMCILVVLKAFALYIFASRASVNIQKIILHKILNAKILFFDQHLSGNVLNRFSRDLAIIDDKLPQVLLDVLNLTLSLFGILFVVSSVNLYFMIPSIIFLIVLVIARHFYMPTGRSIRRLEGSARSPMIGYFNASLEGLTTIRAFKTQEILQREFDRHQDLYSSVFYMNISTTEAFAFYLEVIALIYITVITLSFLFIKTDSLAGEVGLAITQSFNLIKLLHIVVRQWAELENQMTSAERVLEYTKIETEKKSGKSLTNWPTFGKIEYNNVNLKYQEAGPMVLKNVTFSVEKNHKIGVVGRTGAGKSSIIATLFKLYDYKGSILIDNVDISEVQVDLVRSKISVIPQDPILFSNTIRKNLDPNGEHTDEELWEALEEIDMKSVVKSLDSEVKDGGANFSIGQRQLICLARAILKRNLIVVLDEATANMDPETDLLINNTIKKKFSDITVITIAHRLSNIMDADKILVMEMGRIVEYASPKDLMEDPNCRFYNMVKEANLF